MLHVFVVDGDPLHVWAEVAVPSCVVKEQVEVGFPWEGWDLVPRDGGSKAHTREELLLLTGGPQAYKSWRHKNDRAYDEHYEGRRSRSMTDLVMDEVWSGCSLAGRLMLDGLPTEDIESFVATHVCDESCGGR